MVADSNDIGVGKYLRRVLLALAPLLVPIGSAAADLVIAQVSLGTETATVREYGQGARLYLDDINAHGGIDGAKLVLAPRDEAGEAVPAGIVRVDVEPSPEIAFIGTLDGETLQRLLPTLERRGAPLVASLRDAGARSVAHPNVFNVEPATRPDFARIGAALDALGLHRIAVCNPIGSADGRRSASNHRPPPSVAVFARCDGEAARAIAASGAQAVIYDGSTTGAIAFVKALRAEKSFAMVVVTSSVDPQALVHALPPTARYWIAVAADAQDSRLGSRNERDETTREFLATRDRGGAQISVSEASLSGFIAAKLTVEAIRRAGRNPGAADVRGALATLRATTAIDDARHASPGNVRLGIVASNGVVTF